MKVPRSQQRLDEQVSHLSLGFHPAPIFPDWVRSGMHPPQLSLSFLSWRMGTTPAADNCVENKERRA